MGGFGKGWRWGSPWAPPPLPRNPRLVEPLLPQPISHLDLPSGDHIWRSHLDITSGSPLWISLGKMAPSQLPDAMAQRRPESAAPEAGFQQLAEELAALRQELAGLRTTVAELVAALAAAGPPAGAQAPGAQAPGAASTPALAPGSATEPEGGSLPAEIRPMGAPSPSALLARRNAERLAGEVQRRAALASDPGDDTELDLLIDRLHELALAKGPGPGDRQGRA